MPKRILIIDDEPDFTELTGTLLQFHNFEVETHNDPVDLERVIAGKKFDLIVSDLMMPGMDGFGVIRMLRGRDATRTIPIIVLSAKTLSDEERKMLLQNEVHFLTKPFDPQGLVDQIRGLLK